MKYINILLVILLLLLQYRFWFGEGSFTRIIALKKEMALEQEKLIKLKERNKTLEAEVQDLKSRLGAVEERARTDLGMIKQGETFYQYSPEAKS